MKCSLNDAAEYLRRHDDYLILTHRRPDGDTIGCAAALCRILRALGKTAHVYANPQFTPKYEPFLEGLTARSSDAAAAVISVDIASRSLFPFGQEQAQVVLAVDHHGTNDDFAALTHVQADKAACGEIVWQLMALLGVQPTKAIADAVYLAVSTDTGCFRYSNVTANTLRVAADCVAADAQIYPINRVMFETKRWPRLKLESYLVETMEFYRDGLVAVSSIPSALMDTLGLTEDDVDDISGFGRKIEGVGIGVMLREVEGGLGKVSVRTSPRFDAAAICRRFGGGGHAAAAGGSVPGGIPAAKEAVLAAIAEELKER